MAALVAVGGAFLGNAIGVGPSIGWIAGSIIGNLLFPSGEDTVTEGPRLGDLSVTSSAYGAAIPIGYGTLRLAGNIIWSPGIEEVKNVDKQRAGGKGGGGPTQTNITYEYFGNFALGLSEGPADDVLRIWADGKLIYDKTGTADDISKINLNFRFYQGTETQEPDFLIENDQGVNNTPAFRGIAYIVFDRLPLADFGNRIPNITVELTFEQNPMQPFIPTDFLTVDEGGLPGGISQGGNILPDYRRGVFYLFNSSGTPAENFIRRVNSRTMREDRQRAYPVDANGNSVTFVRLITVTPEGFIIMEHQPGNSGRISAIDPDSLEIVSTFGSPGSTVDYFPTRFPRSRDGSSSFCVVSGPLGLQFFVIHVSVLGGIGILEATNGTLEYVWDSDNGPGQEPPGINGSSIITSCPGAVGEGFGEAYCVAGPSFTLPSSSPITLFRINIRAGAFYDPNEDSYSGVEVDTLATFTPGDLIPGETELEDFSSLLYDETDDTVMLQFRSVADVSYMAKYSPQTGNIIWLTEIPGARNNIGGHNLSRIQDGTYGQVSFLRAWALRTTTGELFYDVPVLTQENSAGAGWWDSRTAAYYSIGSGVFGKYLFFRGTGEDTTLASIINDLSLRSGLEQSEIDVGGLGNIPVPGYLLSRQSTIRAAIQPLAQVYFFDGVESDYVLRYILREGKASSASITQDELAVLSDQSGEFFRESRVQEVELPLRYSLTYMDKENDYQQQVHNARRILAPDPTMNSRNEVNVNIPAVLQAETAKRSAEQGLFSSWIERSNYSFQLPWTYLALDPSDVIDVSLDDGTLFRTRLAQTEIGTSFAIDISALSEDAAQYSSTVAADRGIGPTPQSFLSETLTKLILLASPLLRDSDDVGRSTSRLYFAMGGFGQLGWTAASLFKSADNTEFDQVGSVINEMAWGSANNALGDTNTPFSTDETNTLTVYMNTGEDSLTSATQLEMVNGANAAALIRSDGNPEIFQFRDVTVNPDGSRTLSGLLRGRRGTEVFTGDHSAGDLFLLLDTQTGSSLQLDLGERNQNRFYRAVTSGQIFENAMLVTKASPANDLKPYAPVGATATANGNDIDLAWQRRTRVGGALQDGTGAVPLAEDSEAYEVDVIVGGNPTTNSPYNVSTPQFTYTSAQQTADGFTPPLSQITVRIYQISAQVGRGFTKEVTLNVE